MMTPRFGLIVGATLAALVALVLAFVPADWLARLLGVSGADATSFLVRRYGASATAALFVSTVAIARQTTPSRAALLALSAWFGVQGLVAVWGIAVGDGAAQFSRGPNGGLTAVTAVAEQFGRATRVQRARSSGLIEKVLHQEPEQIRPLEMHIVSAAGTDRE